MYGQNLTPSDTNWEKAGILVENLFQKWDNTDRYKDNDCGKQGHTFPKFFTSSFPCPLPILNLM